MPWAASPIDLGIRREHVVTVGAVIPAKDDEGALGGNGRLTPAFQRTADGLSRAIHVVKHKVRPATTSLQPPGQPATSARECRSDDALGGLAIGVRRRARNLWLASKPFSEFLVGFADVPRQRVTTHRLVDREVARGNRLTRG